MIRFAQSFRATSRIWERRFSFQRKTDDPLQLQKVLFGKPEKSVSIWTNQGNAGLKDLKVKKSNEIYGDVKSINSLLRIDSEFFTKKVAVFAKMTAVGVFILPQYAQISTLNDVNEILE